jgi:hypothetical protein
MSQPHRDIQRPTLTDQNRDGEEREFTVKLVAEGDPQLIDTALNLNLGLILLAVVVLSG